MVVEPLTEVMCSALVCVHATVPDIVVGWLLGGGGGGIPPTVTVVVEPKQAEQKSVELLFNEG
jgi:hypothetical protein